MKEPVITHKRINDDITLEGKYRFNAYLTIGLDELGDFYLEIEFKDLSTEKFKILANLAKLPRRLQINSSLIDKENYKITHIVVTSFTANSLLEMDWKCLSDDPNIYPDLNIS